MGRLDYDSEGLILMTNDGELSQHVMHPKYEVEKTYIATLEGRISGQVCRRLLTTACSSMTVGSSLTVARFLMPAAITLWSRWCCTPARTVLFCCIFGSIGFPVRRLVRTEIGPIKLGDLKSGSYRVLSEIVVRSLSKAVGL